MDIIKYNEVQTGGKTQLGGLKEGNVKLEYHGSLKVVVTNDQIRCCKSNNQYYYKDKYFL